MHPLILVLYAVCFAMLVLGVFVIKATGEMRERTKAAESDFQRWLADGDSKTDECHAKAQTRQAG